MVPASGRVPGGLPMTAAGRLIRRFSRLVRKEPINPPTAGSEKTTPMVAPRTPTVSGADVGDDAFEGALAPCAHGWAAVDVVPDRTQSLLEGPGPSSLPFRVVAADVIPE